MVTLKYTKTKLECLKIFFNSLFISRLIILNYVQNYPFKTNNDHRLVWKSPFLKSIITVKSCKTLFYWTLSTPNIVQSYLDIIAKYVEIPSFILFLLDIVNPKYRSVILSYYSKVRWNTNPSILAWCKDAKDTVTYSHLLLSCMFDIIYMINIHYSMCNFATLWSVKCQHLATPKFIIMLMMDQNVN